jgi:glycosyltransferase involved in cell wall biosynthesis
MKVVVLSSNYAPHGRGGAERVARTVAAGIRDLGDEVVVLTTSASEPPERTVDGIRVRSVPLHNVYDLSTNAPALLKPFWHLGDSFNIPMQREVSRVISEERPDVLHSHLVTGFSASAWTAARRLGVPIVHTLHDHYVVCARSTMMKNGATCTSRHLECRLLTQPRMSASRLVSWVVGVSDYVLAAHRAYGAFAESRSSIIPNPCHLVGTPSRTPNGSTTLRLGYMARIEYIKGIETLLEAVDQLPGPWKLQVAGTGDAGYIAALRARFPDPRIEFVGQVEPAAFLSATDVMVVPSLVPETFGLSAAEALACGIPVVASSRGALPELVADGANGYVVPAGVAADLRAVITRVIERPAVVGELSARCAESVAHLAPALIAARYQAVYRAVS